MTKRTLITARLLFALTMAQSLNLHADESQAIDTQETGVLVNELRADCEVTGFRRLFDTDLSDSRRCMLDLVEQKRRLLQTQSEIAQFDDIDFRKKLSTLEAVELRIGRNSYRTVERSVAEPESRQSTHSIDVLNGYTVKQYSQ